MTVLKAELRCNPFFAKLPTYNAGLSIGEARRISRVDPARLASNENPYGCSPGARSALQAPSFEPWWYSESDSGTLRAALSQRFAIPNDRIVLGNGSEALIAAISRAFLEAGQIVITVVPSFGLHEIEPLAMGAEVTKIPMQPDMEFDVEALVTALEAEPRLAFLSSPSNPVGTTLSEAGLRRLLGSVKPGTLFVLDEAYVEFRDGKYAYDSLSILEGSGVNFVSLRTFSKAYGLAGLRIGYGLASNARIAGLMRAALTPFNVNSAAQGAAVASLSDIEWLSETTAAIIATRNRLRLQLETLGLSAVRSEGNFLFIDTGCSATDVAARLLEAGVIVKPWKEKGFESYIRVSIGLPDEMDRFVAALSIILTEG